MALRAIWPEVLWTICYIILNETCKSVRRHVFVIVYLKPKMSSDKIRKKTLYWLDPVNIIQLLHAGEGNMKIYSPKSIIFRGIWYSWVNNFSYFLNLHAINVLLYRMKPRKHIHVHVKYCWQTYFKFIGTLSPNIMRSECFWRFPIIQR